MGRLPGFDYTRPLFYMVTLKKAEAEPPFSEVVGDPEAHFLRADDRTRRIAAAIRSFHETWRCVKPVECFSVMPDHIHLLLKIRPVEKRLSLPRLVWLLERAILRGIRRGQEPAPDPPGRAGGYNTLTPPPGKSVAAGRSAAPQEARSAAPLFQKDWHDWIVKKDGQLAAFTRYIRENPERAWRRAANRRFFTQVGTVRFAGREWFAYGNRELLDLPVVEPFRCSRSWERGGPEWRAALARAERIGPGGAGIGTFMSPCEKECGNAIFRAGGSLVVLSPEGFGQRWHPTRAKEALCAQGRMLFLSLYPPESARPDKATLYRRCHEMGGAIAEGEGVPHPPGGAGATLGAVRAAPCNTLSKPPPGKSVAAGRSAAPHSPRSAASLSPLREKPTP